MTLRRRVLQGAAVLSAGQALSQGLSFVRNIIVARLISPENFGIAATFAITVSLLEMISDLAADKLLIQARDGDGDDLQATAQLWQFTRGVVSAALIAAMAWPMARLFKVPQAQWAFYWLALVPLLRGCVHLDIKRLQRHMRFGPQVLTEVGSQALITAAAWPLAFWLRDYAAMLWLLIAQTGALTVLSHVLAERRYRWRYDREQASRLLSFGWPLLINGILMVAIFQGDRLVVGSMYSMRELGIYSAALTLAMAPSMLAGGIVTSILLPTLSAAQDDRPLFLRRYALCVELLALLGGSLAIVFLCLGPLLLGKLFGQSYAAGGTWLVLLGIAQSARLLRLGPTAAALALGDTQNSMWANVWRLGGLAAALVLGLEHSALIWIPIASLAGELLGLGAALSRLARRHQLSPRVCIQSALSATIMACLPLLVSRLGWSPHGWLESVALTLASTTSCFAIVAIASPALRAECRWVWVHMRRATPVAAIE